MMVSPGGIRSLYPFTIAVRITATRGYNPITEDDSLINLLKSANTPMLTFILEIVVSVGIGLRGGVHADTPHSTEKHSWLSAIRLGATFHFSISFLRLLT